MRAKTKVVTVRFDAVSRRARNGVRISISPPYRTEREEWACLFELTGLRKESCRQEIFGVDALQAMILSIAWLRHRLLCLQKHGYKLYDAGSTEPFAVMRYFDAFSKIA